MSVPAAHVEQTVHAYLERRPEQRDDLALLLDMIASGAELTGRQTLGHVTVSGVCFRPDGKIAQIRHKELGLDLQPGGHCEPSDLTLASAAIRETGEELGIPEQAIDLVDGLPIHIAALWVPGKDTGGLAHWHFDMRYHLRTEADFGPLPADEVDGAFWADPSELIDESLRQTVVLMQAAGA